MNKKTTVESYIAFYIDRSLVNSETFCDFIKQVHLYIDRSKAKELWNEYVTSQQFKYGK